LLLKDVIAILKKKEQKKIKFNNAISIVSIARITKVALDSLVVRNSTIQFYQNKRKLMRNLAHNLLILL